MRKSLLEAIGFFACLTWAGMVGAVGFGGINVTSSLGQPLIAEIELVSVDKSDKSSLSARLASVDAFKGAGIDYPYALPKIKFKVETRANGELYIKATSEQPVNEPFVSLLIELNWSSGRLLREYTFLLDPPGFVAEQPAAAPVKPIETVVASPAITPASVVSSTAAVSEPVPVVTAEVPENPAQQPAKPVVEEKPVVKEAPVAKEKTEKAKSVATESITVKSGDTLNKIARQTKLPDVSLERMMVALYRANADEFEGKNMNRIRVGKILRLPEAEAVSSLKQAEAVKEIHAQVADWNAYRQKLAAATTTNVAQRPKQEVAGKISTSIAEKTPVAKESAKEVLKLSKGEAPGDKTAVTGKSKSSLDKANSKEEEAVAKAKALKEAEERTALLEKNIKDMQRLAELKNQAAAPKPIPASAVPAITVSAPAGVVTLAASQIKAASSVAVAKPKVKTVAPNVVVQPSLMDEVLDNPVILGGGVAALLGLGGLGFVLKRRIGKGGATKKDDKKEDAIEKDIGGTSSRIAAPVAPSPETGDFTGIVASPAVESITDIDDVDPIGEADLFLNFGRDVQAEEVLKEALLKAPSNIPVKLKLLSIYSTRKDTKSFYVYAMEIKESGDEEAWAQAAAMGRVLEPGNVVYGGGEETPLAITLPGDTPAPSVDFDLGFGGDETPLATLDIANVLEADKSAAEKTVIMSAAELQTVQKAPMDFDVTSTKPGVKPLSAEVTSLDMPAMDFDITGTHPGVKGDAPEKSAPDMTAMDFDITGSQTDAGMPTETVAKATDVVSDAAPALNLEDLVFDVSTAPAAADTPAKAPLPEVAAAPPGIDFSIDFPAEVKATEQVQPVAARNIGLSEISLSLDDDFSKPLVSATTEVKDQHWQEVATKIDLAKAYQEMGDNAGAREILEEVLREGDKSQRETAEALIKQLG